MLIIFCTDLDVGVFRKEGEEPRGDQDKTFNCTI